MPRRQPNGTGTIYRRKDGRWEGAMYLQTSVGTRRRIRVYGATHAAAHERLVAKLAQAQRGVPVPDRAWRVAAYLDYWLPIVKRTKRPMTYFSYESIVRLYLKPGIGQKPLSRLTVTELQTYFNDQLDQGCSLRTVQKQRMVLSAALSRAQREELLVRNVARLVELPAWQRKEIRPWTLEQLQTFLATATTEPLYPAFLLLGLYGLRRSELLGLAWGDIDFAAGRLHIRQQLQRYEGEMHLRPVKTSAGQRDLPLLAPARQALLAIRPDSAAPGDLVFRTRFANPIEGGNLLRAFYRISEAAGLPRITVHHLRHTTATLLKNLGVPARDVQLILGHAHISTTQQVYQHADLSGQLQALGHLQELLLGGDGSSRSRQEQPSAPEFSLLNVVFNLAGETGLEPATPGFGVRPAPSEHSTLTEVRARAYGRLRAYLLGSAAVTSSRQIWSRFSHLGRYCLDYDPFPRPAEPAEQGSTTGSDLPPGIDQRAS